MELLNHLITIHKKEFILFIFRTYNKKYIKVEQTYNKR
jgi:hypothetical protein